jgi:hypothetical protein
VAYYPRRRRVGLNGVVGGAEVKKTVQRCWVLPHSSFGGEGLCCSDGRGCIFLGRLLPCLVIGLLSNSGAHKLASPGSRFKASKHSKQGIEEICSWLFSWCLKIPIRRKIGGRNSLKQER